MLRLSSHIELGNYKFDFVNSVEITSTWENITDTCTLKIPKKVRIEKDGFFTEAITAGPDALWKRNDPVKIYLGYDDNNDLRFDGVLTHITPRLPLEFKCEDKMFLLKQQIVEKYSKPSVTLRQMLTDILPIDPTTGKQYAFDCEDISLGKFIIEKCTVVELFDYLKKTPFGLSSYFQDGLLYVGFAYKLSNISQVVGPLAEFEFQRNVIDDANLDYIRDDDVRLKVRVVNRNAQNKIKEYFFGDLVSGELRTIHTYNLAEDDINKIGNEALQKYKYEGFRGSFTTFLQPYVKHGQAIRLVDNRVPDRTGVYLARQVVTTFGMDGGRQEITLDRKI